MNKLLYLLLFYFCFWCQDGFSQTVDESNSNITGFNRIITGSNDWMDIQISGSSGSFKIHDKTNGSNWVRWDAGSNYTEFLKDVHLNSVQLDVDAGNNSTHGLFRGSFAGPQGIQVERIGGDHVRLLANYDRFGGGLVSSSKLRFSVNGNSLTETSMLIDSNGDVGINTTNPTEKLTVNGTIKAQEIIVDENVGADFVFMEEYNLPELREVENHIKQKKHLPDIPSAKKMKQNGVKVGDFQIQLLQKIEELTLYIIELEKQDDLKIKRIRKLEAENQKLQESVQKLFREVETLKSSL